MSKEIVAPMPGTIIDIMVNVGDEVLEYQEVLTLEAMKMENVLRAVADGKVAALHAAPGASLAVDQPIVEFEANE